MNSVYADPFSRNYLMIESFFGLTRRPFLAIPDVNAYYPSEGMESAQQNVKRCLRRGEGISLTFGGRGIGKSLLLRLVAQVFQMEYAAVYISNHRLKTPKALLQQVLFELNQPFCGSDENELRLLLYDHLRHASYPGVVLLIDEAQTLGFNVFEELRIMLNFDNGAAP
ncbi:MAG: AAA family ATPase, partial [Thermoguttaceae bacterium]